MNEFGVSTFSDVTLVDISTGKVIMEGKSVQVEVEVDHKNKDINFGLDVFDGKNYSGTLSGVTISDEFRYMMKLMRYEELINNIKLPRGSGKANIQFDLITSLIISYNSFKRHVEYLKYTNKSVKRNSHLKALRNIETHLGKLLGI